MRRRDLLGAMGALLAVQAEALTPDRPDVIVIPDEDVGYAAAVPLARALAVATGLRVKPVLPVPLAAAPVNEKGQVIAERLMGGMGPAAERLRTRYDAPHALVIVLLGRDLNGADGSTHYIFASNMTDAPTSAISLARRRAAARGGDGVFEARAVKMLLRTVGLQYWHVPRSLDPKSVMFSPLTSLDDLDAMGTELVRPE